MLEKVIDLRSDTVTRPSAAMREAMGHAPVGDDVYGEDPTVRDLEALAAELTGKEAALFLPSGTMANLAAQLVHVRPGDEVIVGQASHCMRFEAGGGAAIAGSQYNVVPGDGLFRAEDVEERLAKEDLHSPGTALVWVEDTHNMGGGRVFPITELRRVAEVCRARFVPLHMDGARVWNAAVASGSSVKEIAENVDSLSFCLSKGLGAPVGSMLCGSAAFRTAAHRVRKRLGGGMRQAGIIAAAGIHALEHNVTRLVEDHDNAKRLALALSRVPGLEVDLERVETNIVMVRDSDGDAAVLAAACRAEGVLFHALGRGRFRLVTHLDVSAGDVDAAARVIAEVHAERPTDPGESITKSAARRR